MTSLSDTTPPSPPTKQCHICEGRAFPSLGTKLARYRRSWKNEKQASLAKKLTVDPQTVSRWERNETQPTIANFENLARLYGTTPDELRNLDHCVVCGREHAALSLPPRPPTTKTWHWWSALAAATLALLSLSTWLGRNGTLRPVPTSSLPTEASLASYINSLFGLSPVEVLALSFLFTIGGTCGGFLWSFRWGKLGGPGKEPHGRYAIEWAAITNLVNVCLLGAFSRLLRGDPSLLLFVASLGGMCLGSLLFYDVPWHGRRGVRDAVGIGWSFLWRERVLVVVWSIAIGGLSFLPALVWEGKFLMFLERLALLTGITSIPVIAFVQMFRAPEHDAARGIIAGVTLRLGLALGLFML